MSNFSSSDKKHMTEAIKLAEKGAGYVSPNPKVGCVITDVDGTVIGKGYHEKYGQAHAEVNAVKSIKDKSGLIDATVYVTLEPCAHHGKTPPCADMLADLPIKRVVIAVDDPNPKVSGAGIRRLRESGKIVELGLMAEEAKAQNEFFFYNIRTRRPFVTLKIAQTLDGYVASPSGDSQWITGKEARTKVHQWRAVYDAVMVGQHTAINDNPSLTVRHTSGRQPQRIVIDGDYSLPKHLALFTDQYEEKTIRITYNQEAFKQEGDPMLALLQPDSFRGQTLLVSRKNGHSNLDEAFEILASRGITSILVEPGRNLATSMIKENLVDKLHVFIAPKILGGGAKSILGLGIERMDEILQLRRTTWEQVGKDLLFTGYF